MAAGFRSTTSHDRPAAPRPRNAKDWTNTEARSKSRPHHLPLFSDPSLNVRMFRLGETDKFSFLPRRVKEIVKNRLWTLLSFYARYLSRHDSLTGFHISYTVRHIMT